MNTTACSGEESASGSKAPPSSPSNKSNSNPGGGNSKQANWLRRQYVTVKGAVLERTSGRLHRLLEQQFNPLFTFSLVAFGQLLYLAWLLSRGSVADANILIRAGVHVHVVALIVGGAAARCALAWLVFPVAEGEAGPPAGVIFDYPHHSKSAQQLVDKKKKDADEKGGEDSSAAVSPSAEKKKVQ